MLDDGGGVLRGGTRLPGPPDRRAGARARQGIELRRRATFDTRVPGASWSPRDAGDVLAGAERRETGARSVHGSVEGLYNRVGWWCMQ